MNNKRQYNQVIEVRGHIIDSLILPRILDELMDLGCEFTIEELQVGRHKDDPSYARIEIIANSLEQLDTAVGRVQTLGAMPLALDDAHLEPSPRDGVLPEGFYATTNLETWIRHSGRWVPVAYPEMDCAIVVEDKGANTHAECRPLADVKKDDLVVVGHHGIKVVPLERSRAPLPVFGFMSSQVSSERPRSTVIREVATWMRASREAGRKILVVAGPAVVHTGSREYLCRLIEGGWVDFLFAGNALAVHDIEAAFYGTSLGVPINGGPPVETGHEHHLRAINRIRAAGSIKAAVESGVLTGGVMYTCVKHGVDYVLAGSIRDDGPLPEVVTDVLEAQAAMRQRIREGVQVAIMLSTMLHSIAVGNLLPASVYTAVVDINPAVPTKLADRGSFQSVGLVMDVGGFLRELIEALERL